VAFSPDGKILATGGPGGSVQLWDVATGQQIGSPLNAEPTVDTGTAMFATGAVTFSPDGTTLAIDTADGPVQLWDVASGQQIGTVGANERHGFGPVEFSPDGKTLIIGGKLWDVGYLVETLASAIQR
jgi:WD40 repeat protein